MKGNIINGGDVSKLFGQIFCVDQPIAFLVSENCASRGA
jgi:hypothetical protein